jgi:5-oxoprolinase (ATP-hydrolysing)
MPPTSTTIFEEGANVESFKIVSDGIFDKKGLDRYMIEIPARYPGSSGCRNIRDVESDLKAVRSLPEYVISSSFVQQQIAANNKGVQLIHASQHRDPFDAEFLLNPISYRRLWSGKSSRVHVSHPHQCRDIGT